ncbi:GntR family transcriptional regulator [Devosia algicola]|uniref:GntR family transcriptional regulator n=1 Tax=Devosia algicola TaxID=3026418 RepID=A0ABY7YJ11_9HYPH|nr:GntR family transcriptional regulator [Devosia algicola]WDR01263.1 GntR family transcriptional regulator [Devosia algicola]
MAVPSAVAGLLQRPARLGDEVYGRIFSQIMSLDIAPGGKISVDALARELGVSQTPIREALGRLEGEGLVTKTHLVGYRAAPRLSAQQFDDLYDLRLVLEPYAAAAAARKISDSDIGHLLALSGRMDGAGEWGGRDEYAHFARFDMEFHDQVAVSSGNAMASEALGRLHTHVHLFRLVYHEQAIAAALAEHAVIVSAIAARDAGGAHEAMRLHIEKSRERFVSRIER